MNNALELERAINNWYYGGNSGGVATIFNCLKMDMEVYVPIHTPDEQISEIKYKRMTGEEEGTYYIPFFTSMEEMDKGPHTYSISKSLQELLSEVQDSGFIINGFGNKLILNREYVDMLKGYKAQSHIHLIKGSVTDMQVGAIVNAANSSLLGGGGVDGAIHKAAGRGLYEECKGLHGCETGEAKITGAYNLTKIDHIIHTVGPVYTGSEQDEELLRSCYRNCLDLALEHNIRSIAFCGISTGIYGYPLEEATRVAFDTILHWIGEHEDVVMNIYMCCFRDDEYDTYKRIMTYRLS